jgi:hypothetical protein
MADYDFAPESRQCIRMGPWLPDLGGALTHYGAEEMRNLWRPAAIAQ